MRKATKNDKDKVVDILSRTFEKNPGVNWILRKGGDHDKKIRSLLNYAFVKALLRDGVYISSNEMGVALCYQFNYKKFHFIELLYQLKFVFTAIDLKRIIKVLNREAYRDRIRPKSGAYLYFWFFGVLPRGSGAAFELKNAILDKAKKENLPIYLETALERNYKIYERFGFSTYHYWKDESEDIQFWFMKWEPKNDLKN